MEDACPVLATLKESGLHLSASFGLYPSADFFSFQLRLLMVPPPCALPLALTLPVSAIQPCFHFLPPAALAATFPPFGPKSSTPPSLASSWAAPASLCSPADLWTLCFLSPPPNARDGQGLGKGCGSGGWGGTCSVCRAGERAVVCVLRAPREDRVKQLSSRARDARGLGAARGAPKGHGGLRAVRRPGSQDRGGS